MSSMNSVCTRCALRLQRAAQTDTRHASRRTFSSSPSQKKGIPTFSETSNPELNEILTTMRTKHFVPGYLKSTERKRIFGDKFRKSLEENPQTAVISGEEIPLQWMNRLTDIPNRKKLINSAIEQMEQSEDGWKNLPQLLIGLKHYGAQPDQAMTEKIVRKAAIAGQLGQVIICLNRVGVTGLSLKNGILRLIVHALRDEPQRQGWTQKAVKKALNEAHALALMLETKEHGRDGRLTTDDPRQQPYIIGVFLNLAATYSHNFEDARDTDGKVRAYAQRLLSCIEQRRASIKENTWTPPQSGPVHEMLDGVPIVHGLKLAQRILGGKMPERRLAEQVVAEYEAGLEKLAAAIEAQSPKKGTYGDQALRWYKEIV